MIEHSTLIEAPADHVWMVFTDVEGWPGWTTSVTQVDVVGGAGPLAVGMQVRIKQPRLPQLTWLVTDVDVGRSWTGSPGRLASPRRPAMKSSSSAPSRAGFAR